MVSEESNRVRICEERLRDVSRELFNTKARLARLEGMISQINQGSGGGGSSLSSYWCVTPGTGGPSTGTWGTLTPASFTADVYRTEGGEQSLLVEGATIYWWYNDTFAADKPIPLMNNGDGTFDAIAEGCTAVAT
jgi:hypothetical protein